jgi:ABC-type uncharacterized transport system permease subunit
VQSLNLLVIAAYGLASALYLAYHAGLRDRVARFARWTLVLAIGLQLVDIGAHCLRGQHPLSSTSEAATFVAWLLAIGYLLASLRVRLAAAGAFAVPAALVLVVLARVLPDAPDLERLGNLAITHVLLSTVGEACFALAAVLAAVYLVRERQLKRKKFARLREDAAPLDTLDRLAARLVSFGFPVFTLAIVTGAVLVARLGLLRHAGGVRFEYVLAVVSWLAFGVLLVARAGAGWQGRRAAYLTLGGFAGAMLVLVGYFLRHVT